MSRITILPDTLCNQIAAGEVVERPAAVVKELVENSIDAGSRKISLNLLQGGRKEIRVVDNGVGMDPDDALLALERHATSKIKTLDDLQAIHSLGFRGEALPSIAAVSRFELTTREADALSGRLIRVESGILRDIRETGCPPGTMITVRDLFYNIPARRKFLRSVETEMAHIGDQFLRLAMAHPEIHFQLTHQERLQYDFPRAGDLIQRAGQVLGFDKIKKLKPFSVQTPSIRLEGLVSPPDVQRASGHSLFVYVNGRPVWDRTVNRAILGAYDSMLPKGKFPMVVLFMEIQPDLVDVNVHPTKREVRFRNPGEILETVRNALLKGLLDSGRRGSLDAPQRPLSSHEQPLPQRSYCLRETQVSLEDLLLRQIERESSSSPVQVKAFPDMAPPAAHMLSPLEDSEPDAFPEESASGGEMFFSRLPVLGQLANSYILLESSDGLILVDQHAAHERVIYDRLCADGPQEAGQRLMQSVVLELLPKEALMLKRWIPSLREIGFEIESFGGNSFVIHTVPAILSNHSPDVLIRELLETAHEDEDAPRWDLLAGLAKTASCHGAIRAGQKLRTEEIHHLLETLDRTRISATCPHGRPLWFKLTLDEIARLFHRT
ncbi:DNA mismatch repair endonuclease MutL [Desulforhabdus amnigena]|uniref:DNA mismatch repair protein MutL n=1 Tax=Desulforhabdus amnigena TaxID=40218 RepID=A0A9W6FU78_9BACT|nr:DNA mismatch repair endonuclease MutL [Desulforhabdus amnigena]NLJ27432.1 DNA mismatch repair endonuclease MutL [Deltaproteobacteria bacterium]GLI34957.1 DNA mismatch repair protein MutL [Desulforhabdus amnigena]